MLRFQLILWSALRSLRVLGGLVLQTEESAASRCSMSIPSPGLRNSALNAGISVLTDDRCCCSFWRRSSWIYAGGDSEYQTLTRAGVRHGNSRIAGLLLAGMVGSYAAFLKESEPWVSRRIRLRFRSRRSWYSGTEVIVAATESGPDARRMTMFGLER